MSASVRTTKRSVQSQDRLGALTWFERLGIAVGIPEITLQADKYLFYREADAELGAVGGLNISITLIVLVGLYFIWLAKLSQERVSYSGRLMWGFPNLLMLIVTAFSVLVAKNRFLAICDLFLLAQAYLLFFYFANRLRTRRCVVFCVMVFAGTLVIQGFVSLTLRAMGSSAYGREFLFGPISFMVQSDGRIGGTLSTPTQCGSVIALLWLPVLAVNLLSNPGYTRRFTDLALIAGGACLILTQTRSAIVLTAVGTLIFGFGLFLRNQLPSRAIKMALAGLIISLIPLLLIIQARVVGDDGGSAESRVHLSWIAIDTIAKSPIFGFGAGNCHLACSDASNSASYRSEWYYTVHCKYLLVWIECGLAGILCFVLLLMNGLRYCLFAWRMRDVFLAPIGLALFAGLVGHMLHMLVDILNSRSTIQMLWVVLGLAAAVYNQSRTQVPHQGFHFGKRRHGA